MTGGGTPLRRADWRFLLPSPANGAFEHLVLLGGPPDLAGRLEQAGFAKRVSTGPTQDALADAVVVLHDSRIDIGGAARRVSSDGVFYCEVDRRHPATMWRTPGRVRRTLEAAGLVTTGAYWTVPDLEATRRYLPLDSEEALAWYFATLQTTGSRPASAADTMMRAVVRGDWSKLGRWVPCFGVTAVGRSRAADESGGLVSLAGAGAATASRAAERHVAMVTSGQDDGSRVVLLPFERGATGPSVVVKVTRSPAFNGYTEREQETLRQLRSQLDAAMRVTIPEPLGVHRHGALVAAVESCAPGPAIVVSSGRRGAPLSAAEDDLRAAAEWLARFHLQARPALGRWDSGLAGRIEGRLARYSRLGAMTGEETRLVALAMGRSKSLGGALVPTVWSHNDFAPWNVHRAGERLTVIDWEFGGDAECGRMGPPLCDLLYFTTYWYQRVRHLRGLADELRGIQELFLDREPTHPAAGLARQVTAEYMARLELSLALRPLLLVHTWVDRALDRASRRDVDKAGAAEANPYRDYVRRLATRADQLFAAADR